MIQGGKIKLILGPMFSGKSTRLVETVRKYTYKNKKTVLVNFIDDKRYSENSQIVTHDLNKYDSLSCQMLGEIYDVIKNYDVIGIDEGQFFPDLVEACEKLSLLKKIVIVLNIYFSLNLTMIFLIFLPMNFFYIFTPWKISPTI